MEPLEIDDATTLDALERLIRRADGFALAFARVNSLPRRRELAADLRRRLDRTVRVIEVDVPPETTDLQAVLARVYAEVEGDGKVALFVYGIERVLSSVRERTGFLPVLNYKRENLQRSVLAPVVLWVPEFALRHIARGAPDTWAWRSGVFEFAAPPEETDRMWRELQGSGGQGEYALMTPAERRKRIETMEALYHDYAERHGMSALDQVAIQADIAVRLGRLYRESADLDMAFEWIIRAINIQNKELNLASSHDVGIMNDLGHILALRGNLSGAVRQFQQAVRGYRQMFGPYHPLTLASLSNQGMALLELENIDEAETLIRLSLEGREKLLGPNHPDTVTSVANLGLLLKAQGNIDGAEYMLRRAVKGFNQSLGPDHPDTLRQVSNLGALLRVRGEFDEAERLHRRAVNGFERMLGPDHQSTLGSANNLGILLTSRGDFDEAENVFRRSLEIASNTLGKSHPNTMLYRDNLDALLAQRHPAPE